MDNFKNIPIIYIGAFALIVVAGGSKLMFGASPIIPENPLITCNNSYITIVKAIDSENENNKKSCISSSGSTIDELTSCLKKVRKNVPLNTCNKDVNSFSGTSTPDTEGVPPSQDEITLRNKFGLDNCRFINEHHELPKYNLSWMAYDIACTPGESFDVKSPGEYTIENIGYGNNLGNYIILKKSSEVGSEQSRIVLGHTTTSRSKGSKLTYGDIIGQTNISGASTGIHVHIELWSGYMNVSREFLLGQEYSQLNGTALLFHRNWNFGQNKNTYYFTHYDLGDPSQNDSSPCTGASGKDLCQLENDGIRTMALTSDIRQELGIQFGDKVRLEGEPDCAGVYQVEDEMNKRFRQTPGILRPYTPYYIKGDLPSKGGGACSIIKL